MVIKMEENAISWAATRSVRFQDELDEWITNRAKLNLRSFNAEITHILLQEKDRESKD